MPPYEQAHGNSGKEKLPLSENKPPAEHVPGMGSHLAQLAGGDGRTTGQKAHCGRDTEINNN